VACSVLIARRNPHNSCAGGEVANEGSVRLQSITNSARRCCDAENISWYFGNGVSGYFRLTGHGARTPAESLGQRIRHRSDFFMGSC
jgi:hypothetical protein